MGVVTSTLWFSDTPNPADVLRQSDAPHALDVPRAHALAAGFFGSDQLASTTMSLDAAVSRSDTALAVGAYPGLTVVTHRDLAVHRASDLARQWLSFAPARTVYLVVTDPGTATGVFGRWENGELKRSFAASPVDILEDVGVPSVFERSFWAGEHPLVYPDGVAPSPHALPFHPMEFAEQALREWLGFRFTRPLADSDLDPSRIPVQGFTPNVRDVTNSAGHHLPPPDPAGPEPTGRTDRTGKGRGKGRIRQWFGFPAPTSDRASES